MRYAPAGVHREAQGEKRPAEWYVIWLGRPHAEGSIVIGRTKRMRRHLWHRCFPESGTACREVKGFTAGMEWLLEEHKAGRLGRRAGNPPVGAVSPGYGCGLGIAAGADPPVVEVVHLVGGCHVPVRQHRLALERIPGCAR